MALTNPLTALKPILSVPALRWYWTNTVLSAFGDSVSSVALLLVIIRETGSVSSMALMAMVVAIPAVVFGILSGVIVDKLEAKRTVFVSQVIRSGIIIGLVYVDSSGVIWIAYVLAFAQSFVGTFDDPARSRVVRQITDSDTRLAVNSLTSSGAMIAGVAGTTAAGTLVGVLNAYWPAFLVTSLAFLLGGCAFSQIPGRFAPAERAESVRSEEERFSRRLREGFTAIRHSHSLSAVMISACASTLGLGAATVLLLPFVSEVLKVNVAWFGAIEGAQTAAMVVASLSIAVFAGRLKPENLVIIALVGAGLGIAALSLAQSIFSLLPIMFVLGIMVAPMGSSYSTILQNDCPPNLIGRVAATLNTVTQSSSLVAMGAAGLLAQVSGIRPTIAAAGVLCVLSGALAWIVFRRAPAETSEDEREEVCIMRQEGAGRSLGDG